jgi:hypothetical protein
MTNIIIHERWYGQRGGNYYYIKEGNILRRIEKYAISKREAYKSSRGIIVEYVVPVDRLHDKIIYEFSFSKQGYFSLQKCTVKAFLNPNIQTLHGFLILLLFNQLMLMNWRA